MGPENERKDRGKRKGGKGSGEGWERGEGGREGTRGKVEKRMAEENRKEWEGYNN